MTLLTVLRGHPGLTIQDMGRPGYLDVGLSRGGAMDQLALVEGAALLGQSPNLAAIEMAGFGGEFRAESSLRIALTGAEMQAKINGNAISWNASHSLQASDTLSIGAINSGVYGYLSIGGGIEAAQTLGSRSTHLGAGLGSPLSDKTSLEIGPDKGEGDNCLPCAPRSNGGIIRIVPSLQTGLFDANVLDRFCATCFSRHSQSNRMGVKLAFSGDGFAAQDGRNVLSEVVVSGDIQITGDGTPFVLMAECQTTGGYPRIGTIIPTDLPKVAQCPTGAEMQFQFVTLDEAVQLQRTEAARQADLRKQVTPLLRDPHQMSDLLSYQLISGVAANDEDYLW